MACNSPLQLRDDDIRAIEASEGFRIISSFLTEESDSLFCRDHSDLPLASKETFLLHRNILHAALLTLLQIHAQAACFAGRVLPRRQDAELELAFRGEARGAFSWLQCFIAEEEDWCDTRGCPACVVQKVLYSEPFIRIVVVACRISEYLQTLIEDSGPELPHFAFLEKATIEAVMADEFWGPHYREEIHGRAGRLEAGVKELMRQCCEVRNVSHVQKRCVSAGPTKCDVKTSKMATRQLTLKREEEDMMKLIINAIWSTLLEDAVREKRTRMVSSTRQSFSLHHVRSLTA